MAVGSEEQEDLRPGDDAVLEYIYRYAAARCTMWEVTKVWLMYPDVTLYLDQRVLFLCASSSFRVASLFPLAPHI